LTQKGRENLPETIGVASFRSVGNDNHPASHRVNAVCFTVTPIDGAINAIADIYGLQVQLC